MSAVERTHGTTRRISWACSTYSRRRKPPLLRQLPPPLTPRQVPTCFARRFPVRPSRWSMCPTRCSPVRSSARAAPCGLRAISSTPRFPARSPSPWVTPLASCPIPASRSSCTWVSTPSTCRARALPATLARATRLSLASPCSRWTALSSPKPATRTVWCSPFPTAPSSRQSR